MDIINDNKGMNINGLYSGFNSILDEYSKMTGDEKKIAGNRIVDFGTHLSNLETAYNSREMSRKTEYEIWNSRY